MIKRARAWPEGHAPRGAAAFPAAEVAPVGAARPRLVVLPLSRRIGNKFALRHQDSTHVYVRPVKT
jgi:hypothetical protein